MSKIINHNADPYINDAKDEKVADEYTHEVIPVAEADDHDVWGNIDGDGPNYRGLGW